MNVRYIAFCVILAFVFSNYLTLRLSGELGFERGEKYGEWKESDANDLTKITMGAVGVCRWAELVGDCQLVDGPHAKALHDAWKHKR